MSRVVVSPLLLRLLLLLLLLLSSPGCKKRCDTPGDEVRIAVSAQSLPSTLDWSASADQSAPNYPVLHAMMRGLTRLDEKHQPIPDLAERWEIELTKETPPRQVYTFHLRTGILWSDGKTPLTARDFVFGWRRAIQGHDGAELADIAGAAEILLERDKKGQSPAEVTRNLKPLVEKLAVEAVDDGTLRVTLRSPSTYFLARIALVYPFFPAPSAELAGKSPDEIHRYFDQPAAGKPLVVGRYTLKRWDKVMNLVELEENPFGPDAGAAGSVKRLTLRESALSPVMFEHCEVDFNFMDDPQALAQAPADLHREPLLSTYWLGLNTSKVNLPLRQAISHALDRAQVTRGLLPSARTAFGYLPTDLPGAVGPGDPLGKSFPTLDVARARKLVAEARAAVNPKWGGEPLKLLVSSGTFLPEMGIAKAIADQLAAVGIPVEIKSTGNFKGDVKTADGRIAPELFLKRSGADYAHPQTFFTFFQKGGNNFTEWDRKKPWDAAEPKSPAELEALLQLGAAQTDVAKMREIYAQAQEILLVKEAVLVPLYYPDRYFRRRAWIEGLGVDPFNFLSFRRMRIAAPASTKEVRSP